MRFGDLLEFRKDIFFDGAVQIDWFFNREKAALVAKNFVFHGNEYHGIEGGKDSNLKDTISFVQEISEKVNNDYNSNPLSLAIATYGTGKSHLAVTMAELFSGPDYDSDTYNSIIQNISCLDANKAREIKQNTQKRNLVLTINGMRDINLNAEILKVAQKTLLLHGCSTENLKKINRALETASRFFERNCKSIELFEEHALEFGFSQKGTDLIELIRTTLFQEEATFNLVNAVYRDINGVDISWDEGISANSILEALLDDYCGSSEPFDGVVILFDEFGRYLEYASNNNSARTGESALQQIFECAQNASGKIQVINFIQSDIKTYMQRIDPTSNISRYIGRYDASDKYHLSSNLETIFANLILRKDKVAFTSYIANRLQQTENYWNDIHTSLVKWTNVRGIWKYYDEYRRVVVQGIFPMHPLSTYALSQLSSYLQNRSSLFLVSEYFEKLKNTNIDLDHDLPFIYPEQLLEGDLFTEILSAEESGRQSTQFCLAFNKIVAKHYDNLNVNCLKILRANLLLRILRFKTENREDAIKALYLFTGLDVETINNALDCLEREFAILGFNEHIGCFDFLENSMGAHDFRVFFKRARANVKLKKDILSDSIIRELAEVIEPVNTKFSSEHKIKTKEWQFEQDMFYVDEISAGYINGLKRDLTEATTPDKPKGKIVWLYTNKNMDYSNIDDVARLASNTNGLPIVFMLLNDKDNKLLNALTDYVALKSFTEQDVNKFSSYYNDMFYEVKRVISDVFESLKGEKVCIDKSGVNVLDARLTVYLANVFEDIYPQVLNFYFDGFENSRGKARSLFYKIVRILFSGKITSNTLQGLGVDGNGRLRNTLSYSAPYSWKCMNDEYIIIEPQNERAMAAYNLIKNKLIEDKYIPYEKLTGELLLAPYGMNDHEVLYLMAVVYANLSYCLRLALNGVQITVGEWLDTVMPYNSRGSLKIDFKKLQATSFIQKNLAGVEARFLQLFRQIEATKDVDEIFALKKILDELLTQEELPEKLTDKYKLLDIKFKDASYVNNKWDNEIESSYSKLEALINNKKSYDIQNGLKEISALENKSIFSCFLIKGFLLKEDKINEVKDLILKFRAVIEPLLQSWINEQRCNKLEDITNFESRMEYFAELLKNAGYEKEAKYALEHIEHEKQKPFLKIKVVHSGIEHLEEEFKNDVDYYGYRKTAKLIEECKNLLKTIREIKPYLANVDEYEENVLSKLTTAKANETRLKEEVDSLEKRLDDISSLDSIRVVVINIKKLKSNDYDEDTEEYLDDLKLHLDNIATQLEKASEKRKNREEFYQAKSEVMQLIKSDIDKLNYDYGRDLMGVIENFFHEVEKELDVKDAEWKKKFIDFDFENADIGSVNGLAYELSDRPTYLKQETISELEVIRKKADAYIAQHKVNSVVEAFRMLNDEQRLICYKLLKDKNLI